jgi:hypothetical protein
MPPRVRTIDRPPRFRRPTPAKGLLATGTSTTAASYLAALLFDARCFLYLKPPAIRAFGVFARNFV